MKNPYLNFVKSFNKCWLFNLVALENIYNETYFLVGNEYINILKWYALIWLFYVFLHYLNI